MHPADLHNPVHPTPSRSLSQHLFLVNISNTQSQSLQGPIELRNHFQEVIHYQHTERSTLRWVGHFRARPQQNGPIRRGGKQCAVPGIIKKPRRTGQTNRRGQRRLDLPARMLPVFFLKSLPESFHELTGITSGAALEEECLWR